MAKTVNNRFGEGLETRYAKLRLLPAINGLWYFKLCTSGQGGFQASQTGRSASYSMELDSHLDPLIRRIIREELFKVTQQTSHILFS